MRTLRYIATAFAISLGCAQPLPAQGYSERVPVIRTIDGDTLVLGHIGRVRLLGIDAPELGQSFDTPAPFAAEARDLLASLVDHRYVTIERDGRRYDRYGRTLAYVFREDGLLVNAAMLRAGLARLTARRAIRHLDRLRQAERAARQARLGIWGERPRLPLDPPERPPVPLKPRVPQ